MSRAYPAFPSDPTDEELARDWTLGAADLAEVRRCRGDDNRHRFAIQLCALRTLGRFADDIESVPVRVANHIGAQLGLPATLFVRTADRMATETGQAQRIRAHLGYTTFDETAQAHLAVLLAARAAEGLAPAALLGIAVAALRSWRMQLPAASTLERLVHRFASRAEQEAWQRIHASLPTALCAQIDQLLEVTEADRRSLLHHLKQSPPQARPGAILTYLERAEFLRGLDLAALDFGGVRPEILATLAELARRYDVKEIRRFVTAKRYAMVACFLAETQKRVLDHIVEMHRSYLLTLQRHARRRLVTREHQAQHRARSGLTTVLRAMRRMMQEPEQRTMRHVYDELGEDVVRGAVAACTQLEAIGERGLYDEIRAGHHLLKRYLPAFLRLPFRAQPGSQGLLAAGLRGRSIVASSAGWAQTRPSTSRQRRGVARSRAQAASPMSRSGSSHSRWRSATRCSPETSTSRRAGITSRSGICSTVPRPGPRRASARTPSSRSRSRPTVRWRVYAARSTPRPQRWRGASATTPSRAWSAIGSPSRRRTRLRLRAACAT